MVRYQKKRKNTLRVMKPKYYIGNLEFKTKKSCEDYTRNIINNLGCCVVDKSHEKYPFFCNLLNNHPKCIEKIGSGIDSFRIQSTALNKKAHETIIKRTDNSEIDFSWVYCCKFKERTVIHDLCRAMRHAIKDDIARFKRRSILKCVYCGIEYGGTKNETKTYYHADHDNPSFEKLTNNFLQTTVKSIPTIFGGCPDTNMTIFEDKDEDFKKEWVEYHAINCNLQILCKPCNLRKKKL